MIDVLLFVLHLLTLVSVNAQGGVTFSAPQSASLINPTLVRPPTFFPICFGSCMTKARCFDSGYLYSTLGCKTGERRAS